MTRDRIAMVRAVFSDVLARGPAYHLARRGLVSPPSPVVLTFSVTGACQSRCKTCNIGRDYLADPSIADAELSLAEISRAFRSLGQIYFFNISGGEPFLRDDLPEIVALACEHLRPRLIHIPTNGLEPERIGHLSRSLLRHVRRYDSTIPVTIKPSIDGIGDRHDAIRGAPGGFDSLRRTIEQLRDLAASFANLHVDLGTVISTLNVDDLDEIEDFVHGLGIESYRHEIGEHRSELRNAGEPIVPDVVTYERLTRRFVAKLERNMAGKRLTTRLLEAMRVEYYHLAVRILRERRQVIPCFAGLSNVHLNYDGEVWPCCVLGYEQPLGHLRDHGFDFDAVFRSARADGVRRRIAAGECACPLANQAFSNILFHPASLARSLLRAARFAAYRRRAKT